MIKLNWWKWLVVIGIPYIILMGFLVPLGQGITDVKPASINTNSEITLSVTGYNTQFNVSKTLEAWLKAKDLHIKSKAVRVQGPQHVSFDFSIPGMPEPNQKYGDLSLIINTDHGPIVLPSAVAIKNTSDSLTNQESGWDSGNLKINPESNLNYPYRNLMGETIRNTFFHVPLWFAMTIVFMISVYFAIRFIRKKDPKDDEKVVALTASGILFGFLGCITGALWAKATWGTYWTFDVKLNMAAIAMLIYCGYFLLRKSISDPDAKAKTSNIYSVFAFALLIPLIFVIPRLTDSLHPGNGGNPALGTEDLDNTLRMVFYPAVVVYILLGLWLADLLYRSNILNLKKQLL